MVRLPAEYQEVEYIESTGTQYIDTGLQFGESDFKIMSRFSQTQRMAAEQPLISIWHSTYQYWNCFIRDANRAVDFYLGGHVVPQSPVLSVSEIIDIALERNGSEWTITQPGSTLSKTYNPSRVNDTSMKIFKRGDLNGTAYARMYSLTAEMDGELAANYVPCYRKSDNEIGMYDTVTGTFYTNQGTGTFLKGNDVTYDPISLLETRRRILLNTPHIESISGSIATFSTDLSANLKECKIHFLPVQEGTGDPSPDNVRPISGWDGVTVYRPKKNLYYRTDGKPAYIPLKKGTIISVRGYFRVVMYDADMTQIQYASLSSSVKAGITLKSDVSYIGFNPEAEGYDYQIELGSEVTDYEPYNGLEIPISFGRTIYGGYVDLVNGEIVETWKSFIADGTESSYPQNSSQRFTVPTDTVNKNLLYERTNPNHLVCDKLLNTAANGMGNPLYRVAILSNQYLQMKITADISTPELFREWLVNNNVQTVCELATPNTYSLTPQTIKSLKGINNIWSDANGDVEVKFWKH